MAMRTYHNDPTLKEFFVNRVKAHAQAGEIIQGQVWRNGTGDATGCTIHHRDVRLYEPELGIPAWVGFMEDWLFESMEPRQAVVFAVQILKAIPVGVDATGVMGRFLHWMLSDDKDGILQRVQEKPAKQAILSVSSLLLTACTVGAVDKQPVLDALINIEHISKECLDTVKELLIAEDAAMAMLSNRQTELAARYVHSVLLQWADLKGRGRSRKRIYKQVAGKLCQLLAQTT